MKVVVQVVLHLGHGGFPQRHVSRDRSPRLEVVVGHGRHARASRLSLHHAKKCSQCPHHSNNHENSGRKNTQFGIELNWIFIVHATGTMFERGKRHFHLEDLHMDRRRFDKGSVLFAGAYPNSPQTCSRWEGRPPWSERRAQRRPSCRRLTRACRRARGQCRSP